MTIISCTSSQLLESESVGVSIKDYNPSRMLRVSTNLIQPGLDFYRCILRWYCIFPAPWLFLVKLVEITGPADNICTSYKGHRPKDNPWI